MENKEYVIKGTVEEMLWVLQNDFDLQYDEAKFFIYALVDRTNCDEINKIDETELNAWYMSQEEEYKGQILNTRYVITFDAVKKDIYHSVYSFFATYFITREINLLLLGAELVFIVASSIKRIAPDDYCIYARIIEMCIGNPEKLFDINDIVTANKDGKCDYLDVSCINQGRDSACTCNSEKVKLTFDNLEKDGVIKRVGARWMLVK